MQLASAGFAGPADGNPRGVPTQRQSIRPPRPLILVLVAIMLLFGLIWGAVTLSVTSGGTSCPSQVQGGQHEDRCR